MSNLPQCCEISVKLRPAIVEALQAAATIANISFEEFIRQLLECEAAVRRLATLPPPPVADAPETHVHRRRDVHPADMSGPTEIYHLRL